MGAASTKSAERVLAALVGRREELIDAFAHVIAGNADPARLGDMSEAAERTIDMLLSAMSDGRALTLEDVAWARPYFRHAMLRGAGQADMLRSCRQVQQVMWQFLDELAGPSAAGRAIAADLARPLIGWVEVFSDVASATFEEVSEAMSASRRQASRRLVEDLLGGRAPEPGSATDLARRAGLDTSTAFAVLAAAPAPASGGSDETALVVAAATLARAAGDPEEAVFAVRDHEVVVIRAMRDDARRYVDAVDAARRRLRQEGIGLAVGISAVHYGLAMVPRAYQEAWTAREQVDRDGGLIALATMSPFEYLLLRAGDATAWQLVPEAIKRFVDDDLSQAGLLIETLEAYIESDLNAKLAAERLYVHPNTAHYRLGKIAEITGCDLRSQADILQLIVAVRLARRR